MHAVQAWAWNLQSALNLTTPLDDHWEYGGRKEFDDVTGELPARSVRLTPYISPLAYVGPKNKFHRGLVGMSGSFMDLFMEAGQDQAVRLRPPKRHGPVA